MVKNKMKAAVWYGKGDVRIEEVAKPKITSDEYLLRVTACGLCKTDVKKIEGTTLSTKGVLEPPRVFGHEIVGEIEEVGSNIKNLYKGERVAIYHHVPCLGCYYCLHGNYAQCETYRKTDTTAGVGKPSGGGFAEYVKVSKLTAERGTIKIPDAVNDIEATLMEPTNCCLKGIRKAHIFMGDTVAVFGQGPIGLTLDQLVKLCGATVIGVDLVDYRLSKAMGEGSVDYGINAKFWGDTFEEKIKEITEGRGVDISIVAVESPKAVEQAIDVTRAGGTVVFFAEYGGEMGAGVLGKMVDLIYGKEITVKGSYSSSYIDHQLAADLVFKKRIKTKEMISHVFALDDIEEAVELAEKRRGFNWEGEKPTEIRESFKIVIVPGEK